MAACAAVLLADVWFGGYKTGLQGLAIVPHSPIVLYAGQTSTSCRAVAFFSDAGASDVTAVAAWSVDSSYIQWDTNASVLISAVSSDDAFIDYATLSATYGGFAAYVYAASFSPAQKPDNDSDHIADEWEAAHGHPCNARLQTLRSNDHQQPLAQHGALEVGIGVLGDEMQHAPAADGGAGGEVLQVHHVLGRDIAGPDEGRDGIALEAEGRAQPPAAQLGAGVTYLLLREIGEYLHSEPQRSRRTQSVKREGHQRNPSPCPLYLRVLVVDVFSPDQEYAILSTRWCRVSAT